VSLYDLLSSTNEGRRGLAGARLRHEVLAALHQALEASGMSKAQLASSLGVRRSAVTGVFKGNGNLRVNTLSQYLFEMGFEGRFVAHPVGAARETALTWRRVAMRAGASPATDAALEAAPQEWVEAGPPAPVRVAARTLRRTDFSIAA